jgi:prepilin-type N-terminal cleavage/methylation domain-containing protein
MLTRIMKSRDDRDAGFTLIELLVVVAIIGILAAIAIPVFLSQRSAARDASVKSDLNGIAKVMETQYVTTNAYPTTTALLTAGNPKISPGNVIVVTVAAAGTSYVIKGCNIESGVTYTYNSATGGLEPAGAGTACISTTVGYSVA